MGPFDEPMSTVDQVMRAAKQPRLPGPPMLGGDFLTSQNIGPVGAPPQPPAPRLPLPASLDEAMFAEPVYPVSGPAGPPVQTPRSAPVGMQTAAPPAAPQVDILPPQRPSTPADDFRARKRRLMTDMAEVMMKGSPAMRVQGLQLLFEVQKDQEAAAEEETKRQQAELERQRNLQLIDRSVADDADKERAKTLTALGARPQDIAEALRFNNAGAEERLKRREKFTKWGSEVATNSRDLGTLEVNADRAIKLLEEGSLTTGLAGWVSSWVPGSDHNKLMAALDPLRTLTGYGYLQEMRQNSPTGGAVGNVTENETKWLMGIQGSLDPVNNDVETLKENIKTVVEGKRIVLRMRQLAPALDAGDPKAWDEYSKLTQQLGQNGAKIAATRKPDKRDVPPENEDIEGRY